MAEPLTPAELHRYSRHLILPQVGPEGQARLKASSVLLIGAGGLGSPAALYLAAAGIGRIGLVDFDLVDETNLQRQVLHSTRHVGKPKLDSARERIRELNPNVAVALHSMTLTAANALEIIRGYDIVLDGSDNFPTRYLVNDATVMLGKPNIYGSVFRFEGQASVFNYRGGPCYRCLYSEPPPPDTIPSCEEGGVLGVVPGLIGMIQATEAIKIALDLGDSLSARLLLFDSLQMTFRELKMRKDPACKVCSLDPSAIRLIDYEEFCRTRSAVAHEFTPADLATAIEKKEPMRIIDVREPHEWEICRIPGAELIPLAQLDLRRSELPRDETIVVYCKTGGRSAKAAAMLKGSGFGKVKNLAGGILRWGRDVDPGMKKY